MEHENQNDNMNKHDEVTIHIDSKTYKSPNPTTGAALYNLGSIDATQYDLFLEVHNHGDDIIIHNDDKEITLKNGQHYYSAQKNLNPGALYHE